MITWDNFFISWLPHAQLPDPSQPVRHSVHLNRSHLLFRKSANYGWLILNDAYLPIGNANHASREVAYRPFQIRSLLNRECPSLTNAVPRLTGSYWESSMTMNYFFGLKSIIAIEKNAQATGPWVRNDFKVMDAFSPSTVARGADATPWRAQNDFKLPTVRAVSRETHEWTCLSPKYLWINLTNLDLLDRDWIRSTEQEHPSLVYLRLKFWSWQHVPPGVCEASSMYRLHLVKNTRLYCRQRWKL